jgi:hypothetical protein
VASIVETGNGFANGVATLLGTDVSTTSLLFGKATRVAFGAGVTTFLGVSGIATLALDDIEVCKVAIVSPSAVAEPRGSSGRDT